MRNGAVLLALSALSVSCSDGTDSGGMILQEPNPVADVNGAWSGSIAVDTVTFTNQPWDYGDADSCLKDVMTIRPGSSAALDASFAQSEANVVGTLHLASGSSIEIRGIANQSAVHHWIVEPRPEIVASCADGTRYRLRVFRGSGEIRIERGSAQRLDGSQFIEYDVLTHDDLAYSGTLRQVLSLTLGRG